jgi:predicted PurR-regulated permease PerM
MSKTKIKKINKHFKFSLTEFHNLFSHNFRFFIYTLLTIFLLLFIGLVFNLNSRLVHITSQVQNIHQIINQENKTIILSNYESESKEILNTFLNSNQACQERAQKALEQTLELIVPSEHKDFHLELVILLDKTLTNCENGLEVNSNKDWQNLLKSATWVK